MRCKKHSSDLSSSVGVCAPCLRERLISLIAAQAQAEAQQSKPQPPPALQEDRRKSDPHPPPLFFPRSVSPYICRRKSDKTVDWPSHGGGHHCHLTASDQLFFSTPQVRPTALDKKKQSRFHVISNFFRSKSHKIGHSGPISDPESDLRISTQSCEASSSTSSSSSWFSSFFSRDRRQQISAAGDGPSEWCRRPCRRDRGMSPHIERVEEEADGSPSPSGFSPEPRNEWKQTPITKQITMKPSHGRFKPSPTRSNVVGLCLSPLVRVGPQKHWNNSCKGVPLEMGYSGEVIRAPMYLPSAASFCKNRSRKLADFGRSNHNR
ncbi:hypothetical protein Ancab_037612 [Ancistrocladus abbreviatus]